MTNFNAYQYFDKLSSKILFIFKLQQNEEKKVPKKAIFSLMTRPLPNPLPPPLMARPLKGL